MTQSKCERCDDWWEPEDGHDWSHRDDRLVAALERIAAALEVAHPSGQPNKDPGPIPSEGWRPRDPEGGAGLWHGKGAHDGSHPDCAVCAPLQVKP